MRTKRKRVSRKNSDSGVSVGSSVGLNTSENSLDKDVSFAKVTSDHLNWDLEPVVLLQDICLAKDFDTKNGVNITNMDPEEVSGDEFAEQPFDFPTFTITTSLKGRTVNGQPLVVPPVELVEPKVDVCYIINSDDDDDDQELTSDEKFCTRWKRKVVQYDVLEITSYSDVFNGATLTDSDIDDFGHSSVSGNEPGNSRCSALFLSEENITLSPVVARRNLIIGNRCNPVKTTPAPECLGVRQKDPPSPVNRQIVKRLRLDTSHSIDTSPTNSTSSSSTSDFSINTSTSGQSVRTVFPSTSLKRKISLSNKKSDNVAENKVHVEITQPKYTPVEYSINPSAPSSITTSAPTSDHSIPIRVCTSLNRKVSNIESGNVSQNKVCSEIISTCGKSPLTARSQLGKPHEQRIKVLDDTIVSAPFNRKSFKIPRPKEKIIPVNNKSIESSVEDDSLSIFISPDLETEIEKDLSSNLLPKPLPLPRPTTYSKSPPIKFGGRWSPPANLENISKAQDEFPSHSRSINPYSRFSDICEPNNVQQNSRVHQKPPTMNPGYVSSNPQPIPMKPGNFSSEPRPVSMIPGNFSSNPLPINVIPGNLGVNPQPITMNPRNLGVNPQPSPFMRLGTMNSTNQPIRPVPRDNVNNNVNPRKNKYSPLMQLTHQLCRRLGFCKLSNCKFNHEISPKFKQVLFESEENWVNIISKYILTECNIVIIEVLMPMIFEYYSKKKLLYQILQFIEPTLQVETINKQHFMHLIISAIINSNEDYDFVNAVDEIILFNGTKTANINDALLDLISKQDYFLTKYWKQIWDLVRFRKTDIPFHIINIIIKECIKMVNDNEDNKYECYRNVSKLLTVHKFDVKRSNKQEMQMFLQQLKYMKLDDCVTAIKDIYDKAGCVINEKVYSYDDNLLESVCDMPSEKTLELENFIIDKNPTEVAVIIREYSHVPAALFEVILSVYNRKVMAMNKLVKLFQEIFYKLEYVTAEGKLKIAIETIAFNLIPLCDSEKDYLSPCAILKLFISNLKSFLSVKNYITKNPYKENLKDDQERIVFFIKIFARGGHLNEAFALIKMPEFELFNKNIIKSLYSYKMKIINLCINRAIAKDLKLSWQIMEYLLKKDTEVANLCGVPEFYSCYLKQFLQNANAETIAEEYSISIKYYYEHLNSDILRAVMANLSTVLNPIELELMYDYCCSKSIYIPHSGSENTITLRQNLTIEEIKLVFKMCFLKMLKLNRAAAELQISLCEVNNANGTNIQLGIFKEPENFEPLSMLLRLSMALFTFQPPINIADHPKRLPVEVVRQCLEFTRRSI